MKVLKALGLSPVFCSHDYLCSMRVSRGQRGLECSDVCSAAVLGTLYLTQYLKILRCSWHCSELSGVIARGRSFCESWHVDIFPSDSLSPLLFPAKCSANQKRTIKPTKKQFTPPTPPPPPSPSPPPTPPRCVAAAASSPWPSASSPSLAPASRRRFSRPPLHHQRRWPRQPHHHRRRRRHRRSQRHQWRSPAARPEKERIWGGFGWGRCRATSGSS